MRKSGLLRQEMMWGYIFVLPAILGVVVWTAWPMIYSAWLAFHKWDLFTNPVPVGFGNFKEAFFEDPLFWHSLKVTAYYTIVGVPLQLIAGFLLALLLNTKIKGITIFRTIYYLPSIVPAVANSVLWMWLLNYEYGIINTFLGLFGVNKIDWLGDPKFVLPALWMMGVWGAGGSMIIYLAGLQGVPKEFYEAAEIDGAGSWSKFLYITIPMMSPVIFFNLIMGLIGSFQVFTVSYVMFQGGSGGPENAALFYVVKLWNHAFRYLEMGYASALAWILFIIILSLTLSVFKVLGPQVYYEGIK